MAFRRSITSRAKLLYQQPRVAAPFPHFHRDDNDKQNPSHNDTVFKNPLISTHFQRRLFGTGNNLGGSNRSRNLFQDRRFAIPAGFGPLIVRNMSTLGEGPPEDVADVLSDEAGDVASQVGPVANEVAIAAADSSMSGAITAAASFMPVAAIQHIFDGVHYCTGFEWGPSILVTTLLMRMIQIPLTINILKSNSRYKLIKPRLKEIDKAMQNKDMTVAEGQKQMKELYKEHGVTRFTPFKGYLMMGPIVCCSYLALSNMPTSWVYGFGDLTTTDSMYIFPILMALTCWTTSECVNPEGSKLLRPTGVGGDFAVLTIQLAAILMLPQPIFSYWIGNRMFSLAFGYALKKLRVKEFFGLPIILSEPDENGCVAPALCQKISKLEKELKELKEKKKNLLR